MGLLTGRVAAMDLGSNLVRLAIGRAQAATYPHIVHKSVGVARIAAGLGRQGVLEQGAIDRAVAVILRHLDVAARFETPVEAAVATGALRLASNRDWAIDRILAETGVRFEVIAGEREADLSALGVRGQVGEGPMTVIDIGGTTTEVLIPGPSGPEYVRSFDIGVITLTEGAAAEGRGDTALMERAARVFDDADLPTPAPRPCFAAGGAAVALQTYRDGGSFLEYIGDGAAGLGAKERADIYRAFLSAEPQSRAARLGITEDHAALVPAGYAILETLLDRLDVAEVIPTGRGVVEGLLCERLGPDRG